MNSYLINKIFPAALYIFIMLSFACYGKSFRTSINLIAGININKLETDFNNDLPESGLKADVIEAVAGGVIFNSLDLLLDTHINRMVVLRPRLSVEETREALTIVFALLGADYDFKFDFNDGSYLCCIEVI
jgi:hypothetical protein